MKTMKAKSSPLMPSSEKDGIVGTGKMAGGEKIRVHCYRCKQMLKNNPQLGTSSQKRERKHKHTLGLIILLLHII